MDPRCPTHWFKSSYSGGSGTECVEVAVGELEVLVRDSKRLTGGQVALGTEAWLGFVAALRETAGA
ncbi:DUF397 domain-containing protein [Streptomyces sp. NPDC093510]|uniref:DUF397 domain-containing protein n=1 Tax=Streptomyces sp. NPDC093510 TaxID=3155199 RepID=UPI003435FB4B